MELDELPLVENESVEELLPLNGVSKTLYVEELEKENMDDDEKYVVVPAVPRVVLADSL